MTDNERIPNGAFAVPNAVPAGQPNQAAQVQSAQAAQAQQTYGQRAYQPNANAYAGQAQGAYAAPQAAPAYAYAPQAVYTAPAPAQAPKSRGWIVGLAIVAALLILALAGIASCTSLAARSVDELGGFGDGMFANGGYAEVETEGDTVAVIRIEGTIQYDGTACSPEGLKELLDEAEGNDDIKAIVLRIDSGGGTSAAAEEMVAYLDQFSKPIVVSSGSMNASAAYEISSRADYIFTLQSTMIGSIGTAIELMDLSGLLEKLGINMDTITSAENKDSTYGYRPLTDEERAYYQDMVTTINEGFIAVVADGRGMSVEDVRALATGMTFTGPDAVANGLADEIGTLEDAIAKAAELGAIEGDDYDVIELSLDIYYMNDMLSLLGYSIDPDTVTGGANVPRVR